MSSPDTWATSAPGPWCTIEKPKGTVEISSLGKGQHRVVAPGVDEQIEGHDAATARAQELARELV